MKEKNNIKYYKLLGEDDIVTYIRVVDDVNLEYLNRENEWVKNQEWYVAIFIDGEEDYLEVTENEVFQYIYDRLNSKKSSKKILKK